MEERLDGGSIAHQGSAVQVCSVLLPPFVCLDRVDDPVGSHLQRALRSGSSYIYQPEDDRSVEWLLDRGTQIASLSGRAPGGSDLAICEASLCQTTPPNSGSCPSVRPSIRAIRMDSHGAPERANRFDQGRRASSGPAGLLGLALSTWRPLAFIPSLVLQTKLRNTWR